MHRRFPLRRFIRLKSQAIGESDVASWCFAEGIHQPVLEFLLNQDDLGMIYRSDSINGITNGTTPGSWTTIPAASIQKAITLSGLTPATIYGFQVQALGVLGYSDWSATETIMCR